MINRDRRHFLFPMFNGHDGQICQQCAKLLPFCINQQFLKEFGSCPRVKCTRGTAGAFTGGIFLSRHLPAEVREKIHYAYVYHGTLYKTMYVNIVFNWEFLSRRLKGCHFTYLHFRLRFVSFRTHVVRETGVILRDLEVVPYALERCDALQAIARTQVKVRHFNISYFNLVCDWP